MRPKPRSAMPGATRRVMLYAPRTLTAKMRSHSSPLTSRKGVGEVMPALFTRAPTGGTERSSAARAFSTDASSVMSQPTPTACTPCCSSISWAASFALASSRSRTATFQPAAARVWAVARPMPRLEPAPVMTAVLSDTDTVPPGRGRGMRGEGGGGQQASGLQEGADPAAGPAGLGRSVGVLDVVRLELEAVVAPVAGGGEGTDRRREVDLAAADAAVDVAADGVTQVHVADAVAEPVHGVDL